MVDNNLYIGSGDGSVYAFRNRRKTGCSGKHRKTMKMSKRIQALIRPLMAGADTFAAVSSYAAEKPGLPRETLPLREGEALSTIINPTSR